MEEERIKQYVVHLDLDIYIEAYNDDHVKSKIKPLKKYLQSHKTLDIVIDNVDVDEY